MVGKVFLYGISFKIVYNQSGLRYDTFLIPFVSQSSGKTINLVKQRWRSMKRHCVFIYLSNKTTKEVRLSFYED